MYKTWIEINQRALANNVKEIRSHINLKTNLWAVIKSNAYGHGLWTFAQAVREIQYKGQDAINGFCVDSVTEGAKLRQNDIIKPILVLGPTIDGQFKEAAKNDITVSISTDFALNQLVKEIPNPKERPALHIKVDTGMSRQGFFVENLDKLAKRLKKEKHNVTGIFSHLASAKDINYPSFSKAQLEKFKVAIAILEKNGFKNLNRHISATAGTMLSSDYHFDTVRIGIGLYGLFPSLELEVQLNQKYKLQPVLSWHSIVSEVKTIPANEFVGYDFTERVNRKTTIAVVPIGYWHGLPWALSRIGEVLIGGQRAKILGRVSMDIIVVDVTGIKVAVADQVTIIGKQGKQEITARQIASKISTTPYEIITRINPLIHRQIKK